MLLYTRLAPPKVPKRRSRAGCTFCKEKKKKCDEIRPQCARCAERGVECTYEAVKPRQRRKKEPQYNFIQNSRSPDEPRLDNCLDSSQWQDDEVEDVCVSDFVIPFDGKPATTILSNLPPVTGENAVSPTNTVAYEFDVSKDEKIQSQSMIWRNSNNSLVSYARSLPPDLAMIAPSPIASPAVEFCIPVFSEFSDRSNRRALVDHFCNVLSHLIVFREESGNPFQQLVLPLSHESTSVMNAIYALASAHLEYRGVGNVEKSIYFHNQAIQGLARLIEKGDRVNKNELLAAIMLLVYYEVLVQRGRSSIVDGHLKGALTIMASSQDSSPASLFLERAFRFYDVITALSLGKPPLSTAPAAGCLLPFPPLDAPPASPLSNVDSLLGMATTLWPIMHRLSSLLSVKVELGQALRMNQSSKVAVLRTEFETTSQAIEAALTQWEPCLPANVTVEEGVLEVVEGEVSERQRLQSILNNALAYRHSAFVYLYRTIYEYLPGHALVQKHAHTSLLHCVETVAHRGPMGALLWPLFVAACEATSEEDRALAEKAFVAIELRQGMTNIEQAWGIIREVWKRLDLLSESSMEGEDTDLWRKVSAEMGVNIVFG
ncbi:fungal-specific transcription factor domain-containing protein [Biscogniauxia marginata]|nr:fungal-specific transcription factor domain-containing protein [Biscogniauxia marginata]